MITVDYLPVDGYTYQQARTAQGRVKRFRTPDAARRYAVGLIRSGVAKETNCCSFGSIFDYFDAYTSAERQRRIEEIAGK